VNDALTISLERSIGAAVRKRYQQLVQQRSHPGFLPVVQMWPAPHTRAAPVSVDRSRHRNQLLSTSNANPCGSIGYRAAAGDFMCLGWGTGNGSALQARFEIVF